MNLWNGLAYSVLFIAVWAFIGGICTSERLSEKAKGIILGVFSIALLFINENYLHF